MAHQEFKREVVSFFGPPGSGKGTVAQLWQQESNVISLSTGSLCRQHIQDQTVHGKEFKRLLESGLLIPDALINAMVRDWLIAHRDTTGSILLDGYPRTAEQVVAWDYAMKYDLPGTAYRVVLFEISDEALISRLSQRLVCSNASCQKVYTVSEGFAHCPGCTSVLVRRHDDEPAVIAKRLAVYAEHKKSLLAAYAERGIEVKIFNVEHIVLSDMFDSFLAVLNESFDGVKQ
jgi:adenylate kinase